MTTESRQRPEKLGQFHTAFENRRTRQTFVSHIAWEYEVWIAEDPDYMHHFNGEYYDCIAKTLQLN